MVGLRILCLLFYCCCQISVPWFLKPLFIVLQTFILIVPIHMNTECASLILRKPMFSSYMTMFTLTRCSYVTHWMLMRRVENYKFLYSTIECSIPKINSHYQQITTDNFSSSDHDRSFQLQQHTCTIWLILEYLGLLIEPKKLHTFLVLLNLMTMIFNS